jgi:hypothetical protein
MTDLARIVRRRVRAAGRRGFVVILHPGVVPLVEIREAGRRSGFSVPVANLYTILAQREAERVRAEKRARRAARKKEVMANGV